MSDRHYSPACLITLALGRWFCVHAAEVRPNARRHSAALLLLLGGHAICAAVVSLTRNYWPVGVGQVLMQCGALAASWMWWRMDAAGEIWISPDPPAGRPARKSARDLERDVRAATA